MADPSKPRIGDLIRERDETAREIRRIYADHDRAALREAEPLEGRLIEIDSLLARTTA